MKLFSDIVMSLDATLHNLSRAQVETFYVSWGANNRSLRKKERVTIWLDDPTGDNRVVLCFEVVLNNKNTAPEKNTDITLSVSHFSGFDPEKRTFTISHPDRHFRFFGSDNNISLKDLYASFMDTITLMIPDENYKYPDLRHYVSAA